VVSHDGKGQPVKSRTNTRETALAALAEHTLDISVKGIPPQAGPVTLGAIGGKGWNLLRGELTMPAAVLSRSALEHNSRWMRAFADKNSLSIAPHGKTTLAPQLFDLQARDGAWAITVSNVQQVALCRAFGFDRILIANQVVGRTEIDYLFGELDRSPDLELFCLVDSREGVRRLAAGATSHRSAARLGMLLEVGITGGRTGARTVDAALAVAREVRDAGLSLRGIEGFEGILKTADEVDAFLGFLAETAMACRRENLFSTEGPVILSAGGTAYFDRVAVLLGKKGSGGNFKVVTRSGCYLTHDSVIYEHALSDMRTRDSGHVLPPDGLRPALTVWTIVQSRPEPGRAILAMGRRDVGFDAGLPVPLLWYSEDSHDHPVAIGDGHSVDALNDQHAYLTCPETSPLAVGDLVGCGISHPCTTFDKWQVLYVVDDNYTVVDAVKTFF
jgi:D-serine dehydratase